MSLRFTAAVALAGACQPATLLAETTHTVTASADTQEFSDDFGSMRSATLEYKFENDDTTVVFTPTVGERRAPGVSETAIGGGATLYRNWSPTVSTRSHLFIAEDSPVFAQLDVAQDLTVKVADRTTATVGARYSEYFGDREVVSLSAGARQYFRFGSVAYRVTYVDPNGRDSYLAHLINLSVRDGRGEGLTQLWLSAGEASLSSAQAPSTFNGNDYAAVLRRVQPIIGKFNLIPTVGYSSYDRPAGRVEAISLGLGLQVSLD